MPDQARSVDFLHLHDNVSRRVRNLETGVHPTNSGLNYYDSFGPEAIDIDSASPWDIPSQQAAPGWQRRMGVVQTFGFVAGQWGADGEYEIATLPFEARPRVDQVFIVPMLGAGMPPYAHLRVERDGTMTLLKPPGAPEGTFASVYLTGGTWAVN